MHQHIEFNISVQTDQPGGGGEGGSGDKALLWLCGTGLNHWQSLSCAPGFFLGVLAGVGRTAERSWLDLNVDTEVLHLV